MLSIVSTPIGNLKDITLRAIETLKECDAIVCEDTRVTGKLLERLGLPKKQLISFHSYSDEKKVNWILERLERGEHLALVSDAGTPCISDPGYKVIAAIKNHRFQAPDSRKIPDSSLRQGFGQQARFQIQVIPGPAAFLAALSASGLPINQFIYLGFLPLKKGRKKLLDSFKEELRTIVFYESVHRIGKTLCELASALGQQPERQVVICRELTKLHEEVIRTTVKELATILFVKKGEFVIVIGPSK